jgi:thiol-disulfide isomerase/thioredoxin
MIDRRTFFASLAAICALPQSAKAYSAISFSPAVWRDVGKSDQVIILNYRASWSFTCDMKASILEMLLNENEAYRAITFVEVDWDTFGQSVLTQKLKVERNSTLLVLKNGREVARLEADPQERRIRALLDTALVA